VSVLFLDLIKKAKENHSKSCLRCPEINALAIEGCIDCINRVHFPRKNNGIIRDYDCQNMIYYYCGRFTLKHATEFYILIKQVEKNLPDKLNVVSIGCGPCTDFVAFDNFIRKSRPNGKLIYTGFDKNPLWASVHGFIEDIVSDKTNIDFNVNQLDVIKHIDSVIDFIKEEKPNIISFQYVLSDMAKFFSLKEVCEFAETIIKTAFAVLPRPVIILFNDTNVRDIYTKLYPSEIKGREILKLIADKVSVNPLVTVEKFYFPYKENDNSIKFGKPHFCKEINLDMIPHDLTSYFRMWNELRGVQLAVVKR